MSPPMQGGDMKNILVRALLAAAGLASVLVIGWAAPAGADEPCSLVVVCTGPAPVDTGTPADQPSAQQPEPAQPQPAAAPDHRSSTEVTADLLVMLNEERASSGLPLFAR